MDVNLNVFFLEDCVTPNKGFSYFHNSLLEHKTFSLKGRNEIQLVISFINTKLNSHCDRVQGLHLLKIFLPQCSDDVFIDNCVSWMQQCVRICSASRQKEIDLLVYEVLGSLFQYSGMIPELTKSVSGSVIPKFLEHIQHVSSNFESRTENAAYLLRCMESVIRNYGGSCGPHKNNIEQFLVKFVDHPDKQTVCLVARCVAVLPLVGGGGVSNVNHKTAWESLQKKLLFCLQETLDALFEGVPEVQLFQSSERSGAEKLHIPVLQESEPFLRIQRLTMRFINLSCFLQELLVHELPVAKRLMPQLFINLLVRGFRVNSNTVSKHITADKLIVGCLIPQMHIALFKLLEALIICCGQNLLEYGSLICRFVLQTLKWTSYDKQWPHGTERPYGQLRKEAYDTLTLWLTVAKAGSCVEVSSPDELIDLLLGDVKISHTAVTLSAARAKGRHLTKQHRKQLKLGQDSTATSSEPSWSRTKLYDETANHDTCAAALRTLQWIVQTTGPFLKPTLHKMIQEELLKILLKIGRGEMFAPYGDWKCRLELYQLLHALVLWPHCSWPPPLQFAFQLMHVGLSDPCVKVASFCSQSLNSFVKLVHPVSRPLHFPPSVVDMQEVIQLENSHKNKVFFSESMDTDKFCSSIHQDNGLLQASSSPKHMDDASGNQIHEKDTSNVKNNTGDKILNTKIMHDKSFCALDDSGVMDSNHPINSQDKSLSNGESSDREVDFMTNDNTSFQQPLNIVTDKKYCDQNDSELVENQNNLNICLQPALLISKDGLQDISVKIVEGSDVSHLHPAADNETKEKCETIDSNCLLEKHEVTRVEGGDEEEEEEEDNGDIDDGDDIDSEDKGYRNEFEDKIDDDKMVSAFVVHTKESSVKDQINLKNPDKTVEKRVTNKAPTSPNNYSISYLYDQSSDSNDSDTENDIVTCSASLESNEVGQDKLKEANLLEHPRTAEMDADEHSQTCNKHENDNENKVDYDETQPISDPQILTNNMCEEKQGSENCINSTADDASKCKVLLCGATDSKDSEVDVTTISAIPEEIKAEKAEQNHKMEVVTVLNEGTVEYKDSSREIQKEHDTENEEAPFIEIPKVKENIKIPGEINVPTEVHCDNDGNSASEVKVDQCISIQIEDGFLVHSNKKKTDSVDKADTIEHDKDMQFERQGKNESSVEIARKELQLQDKNKGTDNEQIIGKQTCFSTNGQESMPEIDCDLVRKEVLDVCMNSVPSNMFSGTEKTDTENLTEPLTKKPKLESCISETENNCQLQKKQDKS